MKYILLNTILFFSVMFGQEITNSIVVGGVTSNSARFWVRIAGISSVNIELSEFEKLIM